MHLEDALKIPGLFAGHRYKGTEKGRYLTIYEIENKNMIDKVLSSKELAEAGEDFSERWKGYMDLEITVYTHIYTASK